jgi:hypothetical protein
MRAINKKKYGVLAIGLLVVALITCWNRHKTEPAQLPSSEVPPVSAVASEPVAEPPVVADPTEKQPEQPRKDPPRTGGGYYGFTPGRKTKQEIEEYERERALARAEQNDLRYTALYNELKLTEEQKNRLMTLKAQEDEAAQRLTRRAIRDTIYNQSSRQAAVDVARSQARADYIAGVRDALGDAVALAVQRFEDAAPVGYIVQRIENRLGEVNRLDPIQTKGLREAVLDAAKDSMGRQSARHLDTPRLLFEASKVLTPEQQAVMRAAANTGALHSPPSEEDYRTPKK